MNSSYWEFESGYEEKVQSNKKYPLFAINSGSGNGVDMFLRAYEEDYEYRCNSYQGFKIILTAPGESLKMSVNTIMLPLENDFHIAIKPKWIITSEDLRNYEPAQRQCFFQSERQLRFFKIYTKLNCEMECLTNYAKLVCDCVQLAMPSTFDLIGFFSFILKGNFH